MPHIGLFTGARVNEICQVNPQTDTREEDGIWYFSITDETEGDERVKKEREDRFIEAASPNSFGATAARIPGLLQIRESFWGKVAVPGMDT